MDKQDIVLISYPRSGANWLCYIIDALWNIETIGLFPDYTTPRFFKDRKARKDKIIRRCHAHRKFEKEEIYRAEKIMCLVRDPIECIISHLIKSNRTPDLETIKSQLTGDPGIEGHTDWLYVLDLYRNYHRDKKLFYYEDLLRETERTLRVLAVFLGEDSDVISGFMEDIEKHKKNSIQNYKILGSAETAVSLNTNYYKKNLTDKDLKEIQDLLGDRGIERYDKQLCPT